LRKQPTQKRSRATVQCILEAAEDLLVSLGYDAIVDSPQILLDRAGVSGGAFYAYFTNPEDVMETLALGYMAQGREMADRLADKEFDSVEAVSEAFIETFRSYYERPQVRELWLQHHLSTAAIHADAKTNLYVAERLQEMLRPLAGSPKGLELRPCEVAVEMSDHLLRFALRSDASGDPALLNEAVIAMTAYLSTHIAKGSS
jgi:AcrR family transcriptional regulator